MIIVKFITNQREACAAIYTTPEITRALLVEAKRPTATIRDIFSRQQHAANTNPYSHEMTTREMLKLGDFTPFRIPEKA